MDVNVKGLDPEMVRRLAEQAEIEGMSAQEWMRSALRRTASLLTPRELQTRSAQREPVSAERYDEVMDAVAERPARRSSSAGSDVRRRGR